MQTERSTSATVEEQKEFDGAYVKEILHRQPTAQRSKRNPNLKKQTLLSKSIIHPFAKTVTYHLTVPVFFASLMKRDVVEVD